MMHGANFPKGHPPVHFGRVGLLLVNLGTPEATDYWSMRRYLSEFLSDRRVIEKSPLIWQPILQGIILSTRPKRKGRDYDAIWNRERNEGPLKTITRAQADQLRDWIAGGGLGSGGDQVVTDWAMRYGKPSIAERIEALQKQGCDRLVVVPLYPQYAGATSATVADQTFRALMKIRWQPAVRIAAPWHDRPVYIAALANSLQEKLKTLDFEPQKIILSYHGLPQAYFDKGDPYYCHCAKTSRLLGEATGLSDRLMMTFQSRFGPDEWLKPYTLETVKALPQQGVRGIVMMTPGFVADCLETIEEIGIENRDAFLAAGGAHFARVDCLNAGPDALNMLADVAQRELAGWL